MHVVDGHVTPEFTKLLVQIAEGYPTTGNLSEGAIRIYAWALSDYTVAEVREACVALFKDGSGFFPSTVEILRRLGSVPADDAGLLAWASFRAAAADVGAYASLEVEDLAAGHALLDVFGSWHAYCGEEEGQSLLAKRKEFLAAYRAERHRASQEPAKPMRLPGLLESGANYVATSRTIVGRISARGDVAVDYDRPLALDAGSEIEP